MSPSLLSMRSAFFNAKDYNPDFKERIESQNIVKSDKEYRFAIVGSGPAGFYCAKQILKNVKKVRVDIFDRNPHPFGLVRTGVAPDHPEMKKIEQDYAEVFSDNERCHFYGNVWVGKNGGIGVEKLKQLYSGIVFAYGATSERELGIEKEYKLKGVLSSRQMANWYNGSLDKTEDFSIDQDLGLEHVRDVAIIGNGNVSMDITRVLLKEPSMMAPFDIPTNVLKQLERSQVRSVQVIGRRGAVQSSFTIKEIREISRIKGVRLFVMRDEFEEGFNEESQREMHDDFSVHARGLRRKMEFLKDTCTFLENEE